MAKNRHEDQETNLSRWWFDRHAFAGMMHEMDALLGFCCCTLPLLFVRAIVHTSSRFSAFSIRAYHEITNETTNKTGASLGQKRVHSALTSTRFLNNSLVHRPIYK